MEDHIKDVILTTSFDDLVLYHLVELTIAADRSGRSLFPDLLSEPAFFRKYFQRWIREALEEKKALSAQADPFSEE